MPRDRMLMPPGWTYHRDEKGAVYFHHAPSGVSQWHPPKPVPPAPPAPPAAAEQPAALHRQLPQQSEHAQHPPHQQGAHQPPAAPQHATAPAAQHGQQPHQPHRQQNAPHPHRQNAHQPHPQRPAQNPGAPASTPAPGDAQGNVRRHEQPDAHAAPRDGQHPAQPQHALNGHHTRPEQHAQPAHHAPSVQLQQHPHNAQPGVARPQAPHGHPVPHDVQGQAPAPQQGAPPPHRGAQAPSPVVPLPQPVVHHPHATLAAQPPPAAARPLPPAPPLIPPSSQAPPFPSPPPAQHHQGSHPPPPPLPGEGRQMAYPPRPAVLQPPQAQPGLPPQPVLHPQLSNGSSQPHSLHWSASNVPGRLNPVIDAVVNGAEPARSSIMFPDQVELLLRDKLWSMGSTHYYVKDFDGQTFFMFRGRDSAPHVKRTELCSVLAQPLFTKCISPFTFHSRTFILNAVTSKAVLTIVKVLFRGPSGMYLCHRGGQDDGKVYLHVKGSVSKRDMIVTEVGHGTEDRVVARVSRDSRRPGISLAENHYVLRIEPMANASLICMLVVVLDSLS